MSTHKPKFIIHGPFSCDDPLHKLTTFMEHNGYTPKPTKNENNEERQTLTFTRGEKGASWWTSNMSQLHTRVLITLTPEQLELAYEIEISGQRLIPEDKAFWPSEVSAARDFLLETVDEPLDVRTAENAREKHRNRSTLSQGLLGFVCALIIVLVGWYMLARIGLL